MKRVTVHSVVLFRLADATDTTHTHAHNHPRITPSHIASVLFFFLKERRSRSALERNILNNSARNTTYSFSQIAPRQISIIKINSIILAPFACTDNVSLVQPFQVYYEVLAGGD